MINKLFGSEEDLLTTKLRELIDIHRKTTELQFDEFEKLINDNTVKIQGTKYARATVLRHQLRSLRQQLLEAQRKLQI